jgi:hypothetical protein
MTAEVAVATVQGKAYFLIVNKLKERDIPFLSLVPGETVPTGIKVVITTEQEKHLIRHVRILVYDGETAPDAAANEIKSIHEAVTKVSKVIRDVDFVSTAVTIKVGNGVPTYKELIEAFDAELPVEVALEVVSEAGTNRSLNHNKHRRGLRDIASAIRIAGRAGHIYPRRKTDENAA